jgi:hypothetical protein
LHKLCKLLGVHCPTIISVGGGKKNLDRDCQGYSVSDFANHLSADFV